MPHLERVLGPDSFSLELEESGLATHRSALAVFDAAPLLDAKGLLDIERIEWMFAWVLAGVPHARQRLRRVPFEEQLVWIDDEHFNLGYHVRHSRLPHPGSERQLKRLVGRLMSERLDRHKPLWEAWVIEGLDDERVALLLKFHPSALAGVQIPLLLARIGALDARTRPELPEWRARPAPAPTQLLADSAAFWQSSARDVLQGAQEALRHPLDALRSARRASASLRDVLAGSVLGPSKTALNPSRVGEHRRVDTLQLSRTEVERIASLLQCSIVELALAAFSGGLARFLAARGDKLEEPVLRALVLLPERSPGTVRIPLPIGESTTPLSRVVEIARALLQAEAGQAEGFDWLERIETWTPARIQQALARATDVRRTAHLSVHFLEGTRQPFTLLGARAQSVVVFEPLFIHEGLSLGIAASGDSLCFGFNSDRDLLPDLHSLVEATGSYFAELRAATGPEPAAASDAENPT